MSTLKTGALRGTSGTADSIQLHASNQSVTFPGAVTFSGTVTGDNNTQDTGLPCFFASNNSTTNLPANTWSRLDFSTEEVDSASAFAETAKFTPQTAGYYYVWAQFQCRFQSAAHWVYLSIYKNGSDAFRYTMVNGRNSDYDNYVVLPLSGIVSMNGSSDYLEVYANNAPDSGTTTIPVYQRHFGAFRLGPN